MTSESPISVDDLLALVAGTLEHEDFVRVAKAVRNDAELQAQLASFEKIRSELVYAMVLDKHQVPVATFAENLAKRVEPGSNVRKKASAHSAWTSWLHNFFSASSTPARFAYGLVAIQTVGLAWLINGAIQTNDGSTASTRSAGADTKQLGTVPTNVTFSISFDPATPESTIRGLLLELEAQLIAGPSQLGQYKIVVARNRAHLALLKLREAVFVENVTELAEEVEKPDTKDANKR